MKNAKNTNRLDLLTQEQIDWCNKYCNFDWYVDDDGKVYASNGHMDFKMKTKNEMKRFLVDFGNCDSFYCWNCTSLESLIGSPEIVGENFDCSGCISLKSLEGSSKEVHGYFACNSCVLLENLKGSPEIVKGYFSCEGCDRLESLDGIPSNLKKQIYFGYNPSLENLDGIKDSIRKNNVKMFYKGSTKLNKYLSILNNRMILDAWKSSNLTLDEFVAKLSEFLENLKR